MYKLWKNKKAANDVSIIATILFIMFSVAVFLPFIQEDLEQPIKDYNVNALDNSVDDETDYTSISSLTILSSVGIMFFWVYSGLPFWFNAFFVALRVILALLIYRQIRSGGG